MDRESDVKTVELCCSELGSCDARSPFALSASAREIGQERQALTGCGGAFGDVLRLLLLWSAVETSLPKSCYSTHTHKRKPVKLVAGSQEMEANTLNMNE